MNELMDEWVDGSLSPDTLKFWGCCVLLTTLVNEFRWV